VIDLNHTPVGDGSSSLEHNKAPSREASSIAMENTLKTVFAEKEEASAKMDERRHQDKEEQMQTFADIQR
jgi:hypothetical protein